MEEKVYKNQISKQALSARIIDDHTPDNQFTLDEKKELLSFHDVDEEHINVQECMEVLNKGSIDSVLMKFVENHYQSITMIDDKDNLLKDNEEAHLTEEEKQQAEEEAALLERILYEEWQRKKEHEDLMKRRLMLVNNNNNNMLNTNSSNNIINNDFLSSQNSDTSPVYNHSYESQS